MCLFFKVWFLYYRLRYQLHQSLCMVSYFSSRKKKQKKNKKNKKKKQSLEIGAIRPKDSPKTNAENYPSGEKRAYGYQLALSQKVP